jgi:hypothetical protein
MTSSEIEDIFNEIFDDTKVKSIETVWEKSKNDDFYKLVMSFHNIVFDTVVIIHTKFIFKFDMKKSDLLDDSFIYLHEINCHYKKVDFKDSEDLKSKVLSIITSNDFGWDLIYLSQFIESPALQLNKWLENNKVSDWSVFEVNYNPKYKIIPCKYISFDFDINLNNNYDISLNISKKNDELYKLQFRYLDNSKTIETESIKNVQSVICSGMIDFIDEVLK